LGRPLSCELTKLKGLALMSSVCPFVHNGCTAANGQGAGENFYTNI